jgi:hypothetical protein
MPGDYRPVIEQDQIGIHNDARLCRVLRGKPEAMGIGPFSGCFYWAIYTPRDPALASLAAPFDGSRGRR